jgi:hypothetical protein
VLGIFAIWIIMPEFAARPQLVRRRSRCIRSAKEILMAWRLVLKQTSCYAENGGGTRMPPCSHGLRTPWLGSGVFAAAIPLSISEITWRVGNRPGLHLLFGEQAQPRPDRLVSRLSSASTNFPGCARWQGRVAARADKNLRQAPWPVAELLGPWSVRLKDRAVRL